MENFLIALNFMKMYNVGTDQAPLNGVCRQTAAKHSWFFLEKVALLKSQKIIWPPEWEGSNYAAAKEKEKKDKKDKKVHVITFGPSVDGVHGRIHEPSVGETRSKNPKWYSHKSHGPALAYEFAMDIFSGRLVWMNGPYPASTPDREIFKDGLMAKIPDGMRVVADSGYSGEPLAHIISGDNVHDHKIVQRFKSLAKARQEAFHARFKANHICSDLFRHDRDRMRKHKIAWTATAVVCQYRLEIEKTFWDI